MKSDDDGNKVTVLVILSMPVHIDVRTDVPVYTLYVMYISTIKNLIVENMFQRYLKFFKKWVCLNFF